MNTTASQGRAPGSSVIIWLQAAVRSADKFPSWLLGLIIRVGIADVFWRSGQTKVSGWHVTQSTVQLFRDEYKLPLLPPEIAANLASIQEHLFSVLLVIGLASRLSALGLLAMTAVIEIFVYPENWPDHLLWAGALLYVLARGPGDFSLDALIRRKFR
ncbi:MAG: DoxX family protein [Candidatus Sulfotelmatobacter sp.]